MLKRSLAIILFLFLSYLISFSQEVRIYGNAPEFAGEELSLLTYTDYITYEEKELVKFTVSEDGRFEAIFGLDQTQYTFLHLGIYDAYVFIEPGKEYNLLFPEREDKTMAQVLNPYFKPTYYHLGVDNYEKQLNYHIAWFDHVYSQLYNRTSELIVKRSNKLNVEKEIEKIDSIFSQYHHPFFDQYKRYKYAMYQHISYFQKSTGISNDYYLNQDVLYQHPAYMELFSQVFDEYFQHVGREYDGKIYKDINRDKSYDSLKVTLAMNDILSNDTLKELVIIKCLYDEFYNDKFSRSGMLQILDSLALESNIPLHKDMAERIRYKVTKLMNGHEPPQFSLFDKDMNEVSLQDFKGKYVYLGFCTSVSYGCIQEFEKLVPLYNNHKNHFEIVMVCVDESLEQMNRFLQQQDYSYKFLHYGNHPEIIKDYDIRAYPTYYFIDPDGKLVMSPAPEPDKSLEEKIFNVMRSRGDL